jgi:hypothetical protein
MPATKTKVSRYVSCKTCHGLGKLDWQWDWGSQVRDELIRKAKIKNHGVRRCFECSGKGWIKKYIYLR